MGVVRHFISLPPQAARDRIRTFLASGNRHCRGEFVSAWSLRLYAPRGRAVDVRLAPSGGEGTIVEIDASMPARQAFVLTTGWYGYGLIAIAVLVGLATHQFSLGHLLSAGSMALGLLVFLLIGGTIVWNSEARNQGRWAWAVIQQAVQVDATAVSDETVESAARTVEKSPATLYAFVCLSVILGAAVLSFLGWSLFRDKKPETPAPRRRVCEYCRGDGRDAFGKTCRHCEGAGELK